MFRQCASNVKRPVSGLAAPYIPIWGSSPLASAFSGLSKRPASRSHQREEEHRPLKQFTSWSPSNANDQRKSFGNLLESLYGSTTQENIIKIAPLYTIKSSPGKGFGVFANTDIRAGTIIMTDEYLMEVPMHPTATSCDEADVLAAFQRLTPLEQKAFLKLYDNRKPGRSEVYSIFMSNAFKFENYSNVLCLDLSRINHSCVPNEYLEFGSKPKQLKAVKPIQKGKEISICYMDEFNHMTKAQRAGYMAANWKFICSCPACSLEPEKQQVSDRRRATINSIMHSLKGFLPLDHKAWESVNLNTTREEAQRIRVQFRRPLKQPLTHGEKVLGHIALAQHLEAEGLLSARVISAYVSSLTEVQNEIRSHNGRIVVLNHIKAALEGLQHCQNLARQMRVPREVMQSLDTRMTQIQAFAPIKLAMQFINDPSDDWRNWYAIRLHKCGTNERGAPILAVVAIKEDSYKDAVSRGQEPGEKEIAVLPAYMRG